MPALFITQKRIDKKNESFLKYSCQSPRQRNNLPIAWQLVVCQALFCLLLEHRNSRFNSDVLSVGTRGRGFSMCLSFLFPLLLNRS
jgi:hypothetical protein